MPCECIDGLSEAPRLGEIDGNAGPVVFNTAENWAAILANIITTPKRQPMPEPNPKARD